MYLKGLHARIFCHCHFRIECKVCYVSANRHLLAHSESLWFAKHIFFRRLDGYMQQNLLGVSIFVCHLLERAPYARAGEFAISTAEIYENQACSLVAPEAKKSNKIPRERRRRERENFGVLT